MGETLLQFGGTRGELMLMAHLIGGLAVFGAAFLPGNTALYRVVCLILGTAMAAWAAQVMMFGGFVPVNALVLLAPAVLLVRGAIGTVRFVVTRPGPRPGMRPHPAARQLGGTGSYQMHPPAAYAAVHASYPASEPVYARAVFGTEPAYAPAAADPWGAPAAADPWGAPAADGQWGAADAADGQWGADGRRGRGAHAAEPTGHIPRQPGPRIRELPSPAGTRARHRAT
ncbi:hypothetical protein ACQP2P_13505 [Dactylosporangium sp. CA-139114]|uniref:hypothetical protein n=1 Tax=Dactylosporangium sp. CA-139114 TaxID=3239931 RepID=UPI003D99B8F9